MTKRKMFLVVTSLMLFFGGYFLYRSYYEENFANTEKGKVEIAFINGFTGGDGAYMKKITDGFNQSQDKYHIVELQEKDHYTKFKSGNYDLVVIHGNNLDTYKKDGLIQDISPVLEKAGIKETDFHPAGLKIMKLDGKLFAAPLDIHPLTMLYNKDFVSQEVSTYEDLIKLNTVLQAKNKNVYALGVPSSGLVEFYMLTIAAQNGIDLKKDNYLNFSQPEFADALMTFHDMIWKDKISPPGLGLDGEFQSFMKQAKGGGGTAQTAIALTGPWFYGAAKEQYGDRLGVTSVPKLGEKQAVYGNSHTIALSSKVEDPEVLEGISAFLEYLYTPEHLIHWAEGGQAPLHLPTIKLMEEHKEKYEVAYANTQQFDTFVPAPQVYLFGEQMRYMNTTVFTKLVSNKNFTKEQLMDELNKATDLAKQIGNAEPKK
ncbi:extracellular solute-binding protein [Metabacillus sp. Hm71]|uniref:extracellular solute-binding protein n=1 Tax=Metabacillus sp. Hm71 TaxID=3450743 RepID=UPI003F43D35A